MKLYVDRLAPNARRVLMYVAEKKIDVSVIEISVAADENRSAEFLEKNPLGQVPVLELPSGVCIAESMAICRYLDETSPQPSLFGEGAEERAVIHMWSRRMESALFVAAVEFGHHSQPSLGERFDQIPAYAEQCRASIERACALADSQLEKATFVAGETFSVADIIAFCGLELARLWQAPPDPSLASLGRWHQAICERPSADVARYL